MNYKDLLELSKPKIGILILITSLIGFFYGSVNSFNYTAFIALCIGTLSSASGSAMLNNYLERDYDKLMERTKNRALPAGRVQPQTALGTGLILVLAGVMILWYGCNLLTAFCSLLTAFLYVLVYTPMKRLSTLNTIVGAIPGALPAAGGVVAATNEFNFQALILFWLLFIWQMPHFFSIAWLCKKDYEKAGFRMLPSIARGDYLTCAQMIAFALLLIPISFFPYMDNFGQEIYLLGALSSAFIMIYFSVKFGLNPSESAARKVLWASLIYFPVILISLFVEKLVY